jgi:predicted nucleic acid-binding protein
MTARDAIHIAVMERREIRSILSFDADFALTLRLA